MQRVNAMDEKLSLEGFDAVWQRVTEHREPDIAPMQSIASHDQADRKSTRLNSSHTS